MNVTTKPPLHRHPGWAGSSSNTLSALKSRATALDALKPKSLLTQDKLV